MFSIFVLKHLFAISRQKTKRNGIVIKKEGGQIRDSPKIRLRKGRTSHKGRFKYALKRYYKQTLDRLLVNQCSVTFSKAFTFKIHFSATLYSFQPF